MSRSEVVDAVQDPPRKKKKLDVEMLPPAEHVEVQPPGSIPETLNQRRLREFYQAEKEFHEARDRYQALYLQVQHLVIRGAGVQSGQYKIAHKVYRRRHPRYKQALIDAKGEAYQMRILNATAPHEVLRVRVT